MPEIEEEPQEAKTPRKRPTRSRLDVAERRAQIQAAAQAVFDEQPYDAVNMAAIAERAGVSRALLFHYFESKRGLYLAVLKETLEEIFELLDQDPALPPEEDFVAGVRRYFAYVDSHAVRFSALIGGGLAGDPEVQAFRLEHHDRHVARIAAAAGIDLVGDPRSRAALHGFLGFCETLGHDYLRHRDLSIDDLTVLAVRAASSGFPEMAAMHERALRKAGLVR